MSEQGPTEPQQPDALHHVHREIDAVNARVDRQDARSENRYNILTTLIDQVSTNLHNAINLLRTEFTAVTNKLGERIDQLNARMDKFEIRLSRVEKLLILSIFFHILVLAEGEIGQAIQALASALLQLLK